jgi:hypothetical protein
MALLENGQTCLENIAIEKRPIELNRNEYNNSNPYSCAHPNAQSSDGDSRGKGTGCEGHTYSTPDCTNVTLDSNGIVITSIDTSNLNTLEGGSCIDIKGMPNISHSGRHGNVLINNYSALNGVEYGANLVNTQQNVGYGQVQVGYTQRTVLECNI